MTHYMTHLLKNLSIFLVFIGHIELNHINVSIRKGMGADIDAACGQLRKKYIDNISDNNR